MKKIIRLTESDLTRLVKRVLMEENETNKQKFDACVAKYVKPTEQENIENFYNRTEVKNTCSAIRNNLSKYDNLFNDYKYIKTDTDRVNILLNCFFSVPENKNQEQGKLDVSGNMIQKGNEKQWDFIECFLGK